MAIPYRDTLIANINSHFSGEVALSLLSQPQYSTQLFFLMMTHFSELMVTHSKLSTLDNFYGEKAEVTFEGVTYSSLAIINKEELLGEWQVFKEKVMIEKNTSTRSLQDTMETSACIFPETLKMQNIFLALPIATASVERLFSHLKIIKTSLRSCLSDCSAVQLMRISKGLKLMQWNLRKYWRFLKNIIIEYYFDCVV